MKKFKMGMAFGLSALTLFSIASCDVTAKDDLVLTYKITTSSGEVKEAKIDAQDVLDRYLKTNPKDHAKAYYDAIYDVAVRVAFQQGGVLNKYYDEVESSTKTKITNLKKEADKNDQKWSDYLATLSYYDDSLSDEENEKLLYATEELKIMKERVTKEFSEEFNEWNKEKYTGEDLKTQKNYNQLWGDNGYLNVNMPYAVRHLLVKCGDSTDNFTSSKITSAQVTKLHRVFERLLSTNTDTNTFGTIAHDESEDSGSVERNGVYMMGTKTSFVNEFKLGLYAYESIFNEEKQSVYEAFINSKNSDGSSDFIGFGGTSEAKNTVKDIGVNYIPYEAVEKLYEYRDLESLNGKKVNEGNENYYPRNIVFNKYFNVHNVSFIVNEKCDTSEPTNTNFTYSDNGQGVYSDLDANGKYKNDTTPYFDSTTTESTKFMEVPGLKNSDGSNKKVLCDEKGNPIMLVVNATSSGGIHMITVERDYFDFVDTTTGEATKELEITDSNAKDGKYSVSINEYYAPKSPIYQEGYNSSGKPYYNVDNGSFKGEFPYYEGTDGTNYPKATFINNDVYTTPSKYDSLVSSTITSEVTSNSYIAEDNIKSNNEFLWLANTSDIKAKDEKANALVELYKKNLENTSSQTNRENLNNSWDEYATTLKNQDYARKYGLIPYTCALHFKDADTDARYQKGGICYYSTSTK